MTDRDASYKQHIEDLENMVRQYGGRDDEIKSLKSQVAALQRSLAKTGADKQRAPFEELAEICPDLGDELRAFGEMADDPGVRCYSIQHGDSLERICARFVRQYQDLERMLTARNPHSPYSFRN